MIRAPGSPDPPVQRLLGRLGAEAAHGPDTLVLGAGTVRESGALDDLLGGGDGRILVLSSLGAHPDARVERLRWLWRIEERARRSGRAVLTLRLAPVLGPASPLWHRLRSRPRLARDAEILFSPVLEDDVVETLLRALDGRAAWQGWFAVAGPEVLTLAEVATLADAAGRLPSGAGAWEPPLEEIREQRIPEPGPWSAHFGLTPGAVTDRAERWS